MNTEFSAVGFMCAGAIAAIVAFYHVISWAIEELIKWSIV